MIEDSNPLWDTTQTAQFLDIPESTLVKWRRIRRLRESQKAAKHDGTHVMNDVELEIAKIKGPKLSGPPYIHLGERKIRYRKSDVLEWAENPH